MLAKAYLEITNICNRKCAFCPGTKRHPQMMDVPTFTLLAKKLRNVTDHLYFHLMGEPLLHPSLGEFLQIASQLGFHVILTTNGTLLKGCEPTLLHAPLKKVNISLHSFEANECGDFAAYVRDCAAFGMKASQRGIIVNYRLWNLDGQTTVGQHSKNDELLLLLHEVFAEPWQQNTRGYRLKDRVFLEWGEKFDWPDENATDYGERGFCYGLRDQIGVLVDGTVVPCCLDCDGTLKLGNLLEQSIEEILQGAPAQAIYQGFSNRKATQQLCRHCGYKERFGKK